MKTNIVSSSKVFQSLWLSSCRAVIIRLFLFYRTFNLKVSVHVPKIKRSIKNNIQKKLNKNKFSEFSIAKRWIFSAFYDLVKWDSYSNTYSLPTNSCYVQTLLISNYSMYWICFCGNLSWKHFCIHFYIFDFSVCLLHFGRTTAY